VKRFRWNLEKNDKLKQERNIRFKNVVKAINNGYLLDVIKHYNPGKYPNQLIFVVKVKNYVYIIPFVENESEIFLKTIIPSRKLKKKYLGD